MPPRGLLFDYGGTLVEEISVDVRAGNEWLLSRASHRPAHVSLEDVLERARRVSSEVAGRRDLVHLETAWPTLTTSFGEEVIRYELGKHGLADHLAFVMVSADYSVRKPNVFLFEIAAAKLEIAPQDIWFMGDRLDTDVAGAKAAGMTAVWLNPNNRHDPSGSADLTVAGWDAFLRLVLEAIASAQSWEWHSRLCPPDRDHRRGV